MFKYLIVSFIAGFMFVSFLSSAKEDLTVGMDFQTPYERCTSNFEGTSNETQCKYLK